MKALMLQGMQLVHLRSVIKPASLGKAFAQASLWLIFLNYYHWIVRCWLYCFIISHYFESIINLIVGDIVGTTPLL